MSYSLYAKDTDGGVWEAESMQELIDTIAENNANPGRNKVDIKEVYLYAWSHRGNEYKFTLDKGDVDLLGREILRKTDDLLEEY